MRRKKRYLLPGDVKAKIHLFLPTILYILTIHLYFLTFAHFLFFTLHFLFLFVLQSKDFIVFLQKNQTTYQMKRNKKNIIKIVKIDEHIGDATISFGEEAEMEESEQEIGK